jgi:hypothetical protein
MKQIEKMIRTFCNIYAMVAFFSFFPVNVPVIEPPAPPKIIRYDKKGELI